MENPLTPEEIHAKYLSLATTVTSAAHAEQIAGIVQRVDRMPDIARLTGLLRSLKPAGNSTTRRAKTGTSRATAKGVAAR
jgi:DNA-binding phage protein